MKVGVEEMLDLMHSRRSLMKIGSLGIGGLTLPNLLRQEARAAEETGTKKRRKAVILLWLALRRPSLHDTS